MFTRPSKLKNFTIAAVTAVFALTTLAPAAMADHRGRHHKKTKHVVHHVVHYDDWRGDRYYKRHYKRHHKRHHRHGPRVIKKKVVVHHHHHGRPVYYGGSTYHGGVNGTAVGGLLGAVLGAAVGSQFGKGSGRAAAIIGGGVLGAIVGGNIGRSMDRNDQYRTNNALETSRTGQQTTWRNPDSGNEYTVTPTRTYETSGGYCREYTTWGYIGGYEEKLYGTACRQPDGSWKRVN